MPSLKLSNPFRRGADRPSLKQRAASLKATAARVMRRKPADPFEGIPCPPGFVPYPFNEPMSYASIPAVIHSEAIRLLDLAQAEYARRCGSFVDHVGDEEREARRQVHRSALHLDALAALASVKGRSVQSAPNNAEGDAALLDLGRQFEAARLAEEAADHAFSEADQRADAVRPAKPDSLVFRASDHDYVLRQHHMHPDAWEGLEVFHDDIAWMRKRTFTHEVWREAQAGERAWHGHGGKLPEIQPYPEAEARAAELIGIWDAWQAECDRTEAECGVPAAADASSAAFQATKAIAAQIAAIPAHTAEGLKVKIRALDFYAYQASKDEPDALLMRSLIRDAAAPTPAPGRDEPFSLEAAAALSFEAISFDGPACSPARWAEKLGQYAVPMVLAEKLLRMGKAEMEAFTRDIGEEDASAPETLLRNLDATQETFEGWAKLLIVANARYTIAASSAVLKAETKAEG